MAKQNQREKMTQEIKIHQSLKHKHIVGFYNFFEDQFNIYIVLELCRRRVSCFRYSDNSFYKISLYTCFSILVLLGYLYYLKNGIYDLFICIHSNSFLANNRINKYALIYLETWLYVIYKV